MKNTWKTGEKHVFLQTNEKHMFAQTDEKHVFSCEKQISARFWTCEKHMKNMGFSCVAQLPVYKIVYATQLIKLIHITEIKAIKLK